MALDQKLDLREIRASALKYTRGLFQEYFDDVQYPGQFDMDALCRVWAPLLENDHATMRVLFVGSRAAAVYGVTYMQDTFNGEMTATMVFFWVAPHARGQGFGTALLEQAELDAALHGCTNLVHGHMFTVDRDGGRGMFEKRGYEVIELGFRKRL